MISEKNLEKTKQLIKNSQAEPIIVKAINLEYNRKILEYGKFDILLSVEKSEDIKKDTPRNTNSGFNHVLAKIAVKNNISLGIDLENLRKQEKKSKAVLLTRIKQNIKLCRKSKCRVYLINCKDKRDASSFLISLGASTFQAKEAILKTTNF